jgi:glycosyltransferase involved in cell wall biosynthesis
MIPTFNCARYVGLTLESVLSQDPGRENMQIEVIDDCSTDEVRDVVADAGRGRVDFYQQQANVGQARNCATCLQRARGHLIHILHGDDAVRQGFYDTMGRPFEAIPELGAAFCGYIMTNSEGRWDRISYRTEETSGILDRWLERVAVYNHAPPSATVARRSVYEKLGGFDERLGAIDWEMWVRVAAHFPVWYEPEPLVLYRRHGASVSGGPTPTGAHIADMRRIIEVNRALLPPEREAEITAKALENASMIALDRGLNAIKRGDTRMWWEHNVEALRTSRAPRILGYTAYFNARGLLPWLFRKLRRRSEL